ncbi:MAG: TetR/AcrR family transcriptional regulator [Leucobacter sp.]
MSTTAPRSASTGLNHDLVVDAAVELTRESHLFSWSIRDLAKRLGVGPSTIYHHVGGKDLLCRRVVERVGEHLVVPDPGLDWREWFRELLTSMGPIAMQYPGVAKWMLLHGPNTQAVMPAFGAGFAALNRAGFGEHTSIAYALLMNNPMLTIALGDDRLLHEEDGPRDHAAMMHEFQRVAAGQPGMDTFMNALMRPYADGGESAAQARFAYFRFCIEITIAGLSSWLESGLTPFSTLTEAEGAS